MEKVIKLCNNNFLKILVGSIISLLVSIFGFFAFASILTNTNITETIIPFVIIVISMLSIVIGSIISLRKIKKNGILNGAAVGIMYIIFIYILSSIIFVDFKLNAYSIIMIVGAIASGIIGGIIGVNVNKNI